MIESTGVDCHRAPIMIRTDLNSFRDREDAGRRLAEWFRGRALHHPLVLAIPRGGVAVGAALAREIGAELDVVLARKLRAPYQPEFAVGAIGEDGWVTLHPKVWDIPGVTVEYLAEERGRQLDEIERRKTAVRLAKPVATIGGRSIIVTDDGIATGATMIAALQSIRSQVPHELIVAVPVASPDRLAEVRRWCDDSVCLLTPYDFDAVGRYYQDFRPVEDDEVIEWLLSVGTPTDRADRSM
jgi:predicted phosphoribosyltransferase